MSMLKPQLRNTLQAVREDPKKALVIALVWLLLGMVWALRGGSFIYYAVFTTVGLLVAIFIAPPIERIVTGKEYLSDIEDFSQERLLPLMEKLKTSGIDVVLLEPTSDGRRAFQPLAPFKSIEHLAHIRLPLHQVDFIHIGYWTDVRLKTGAFYFDFAIECEIQDEVQRYATLDMRKRFLLFGKRRFKWRGEALAQSLNRDERLRENLSDASAIMDLPALWVVPDAEEGLVHIHIPYVKRVDPKQFPAILAVAGQIAHHIKSLAQSRLSVEED